MTNLRVIEPDEPTVIEVLDELREMLREGELASIAIAFVRKDDTVGSKWSAGEAARILGAIRRMEHHFNRQWETDG